MQRFLFIIILWAQTAYGQPPKGGPGDSIRLSVPAVRNMLIAAEQSKVLKEQVVILNDRISNYENIVVNLKQKDSMTVVSFQSQIVTMKEQRALLEDQIKGFERLLKIEKRKRTMTTLAGTLTTGIAMYLFITK